MDCSEMTAHDRRWLCFGEGRQADRKASGFELTDFPKRKDSNRRTLGGAICRDL